MDDWDLRDAYEQAMAEIDRLLVDNAALREAIQFAIDSSMSYIDDDATLAHLRAVLTKTEK